MFACTFCDKKFTTQPELRGHCLKHTKNKRKTALRRPRDRHGRFCKIKNEEDKLHMVEQPFQLIEIT